VAESEWWPELEELRPAIAERLVEQWAGAARTDGEVLREPAEHLCRLLEAATLVAEPAVLQEGLRWLGDVARARGLPPDLGPLARRAVAGLPLPPAAERILAAAG
jgi:hypothetical protein